MARPQYDADIVTSAHDVSISEAVKNYILAQQELDSMKAHTDFAKAVMMYKVLNDEINGKTRTTIVHSKDKLGIDDDLETEQIYINDGVYDIYLKEQVRTNTSTMQIRNRLQSAIAQAEADASLGRDTTCKRLDVLREVMDIINDAKSVTTFYQSDIKPTRR